MYKDEMFRDEKFVTINDIRISKNGFKNLSFETSRYADGIESIRGFGTNLNERNLSIIDTISIDFLIDYTELKEFALVYSMFKAIGALPITNDYILEKIKGTLAYERAISLTRDKNAKTITHLIVLLERMEITSLERTDSGFSVNMILTLYRHGYSSSEFAIFKKKYSDWENETGFRDKCETEIKGYISKFKTDGSLRLKVYNSEKLNAGYKASMLLNEGDKDSYFKEDEKGQKEEEYNVRYETLRKFEDMKPTVIEIPSVHIGQLELITHNNIANLPLYGEPIGIKSYMGIGRTSFIVKMIFDERDEAILKQLKELSDLSIVNHKINIEIPIVNLFDFHTSTITNIFFNNIEEANGVMVTIKFELNGYDFYKDENNSESLNLNLTTNLDRSSKSNKTIDMVTYYFENVLRELSFRKHKNVEANVNNFYSSIIATEISNTVGEGAVSGPATQKELITTRSTIFDFLCIFSSGVSSYFAPYFELKYKDSDLRPALGEDDVSFGNLYKFDKIDIISDEFFKFRKTPANDSEAYDILKVFKNMIISDKFLHREVKVEKNSSQSDRLVSSESIAESFFSFREIQRTNMYKFLDSLGVLSIYGSERLKKDFSKLFFNKSYTYQDAPLTSESYSVNDTDNGFMHAFNDKVIYEFINTIYSEKINSNEGVVFNRYLYMSLIYDMVNILNTNMNKTVEKIKYESFLNSSDDVMYNKIKISIKELMTTMKEQVLNRLNNPFFIKEVVRLTSINLSSRLENSPEDYTAEKISLIFEEHIEKTINEISIKLKTDFDTVVDQVNLIALSKIIMAYGNISASKINVQSNKVDLANIIKTNIISSSLMGLFLFRCKNRTDNLGLLFDNMVNNIGTKLGEYYFVMKKYDSKINGLETDKEDYDFFKDYHNEYYNSEKQNTAHTGIWSVTKYDKINTLKKDFLFFYGNKIKSIDVESILWSFETMKDKEKSFQFLDTFLAKKKNDFSTGDLYHEQVDYELKYKPGRGAIIPSYFKNLFHFEGKINPIMRKRIIGNDDPFMNMKKITELVSYINKEIIPDYDITVFTADYKGNGIGVFSDFEFSSSFSLNNVSSVRISKDPKTKIKTAKISIIDLEKKLINKDKSNNTISFKANINGDVEIYTVEVGDSINIDLGYGPDKTNEFRGVINSIFNAGNYIEITCVGLGATLYSSLIKEMKLGKDSDSITSFIHTKFKELSYTSDKIVREVYNSLFSERNCNNHLFNAIDENKNEFMKSGEESSMYNAAVMAISTLGQSVKNKFFHSNVNSSSAFYKKIVEETMKVFGEVGESNKNSTMSNVEFFKNIFNVDRDYEAYGLLQNKTRTVNNSNGSNLEKVDVIEEIKVEESKSEQLANSEFEMKSITEDPKKIASSFTWPCQSNRITSPFGKTRTIARYDKNGNKYMKTSVHKGLDIGPIRKGNMIHDEDNKIWASGDGTILASYFSTSYGNCVIILHTGKKIKTVYAHLKKINANIIPGKSVKKGDELGIMGNTTKEVANMAIHLHFEVRINDVHVDPVSFLQGEEKKINSNDPIVQETNSAPDKFQEKYPPQNK